MLHCGCTDCIRAAFLFPTHKDTATGLPGFNRYSSSPALLLLNLCMKKCKTLENVVKGGKEINGCDLRLAAFRSGKKHQNQEAFSVFSCDL